MILVTLTAIIYLIALAKIRNATPRSTKKAFGFFLPVTAIVLPLLTYLVIPPLDILMLGPVHDTATFWGGAYLDLKSTPSDTVRGAFYMVLFFTAVGLVFFFAAFRFASARRELIESALPRLLLPTQRRSFWWTVFALNAIGIVMNYYLVFRTGGISNYYQTPWALRYDLLEEGGLGMVGYLRSLAMFGSFMMVLGLYIAPSLSIRVSCALFLIHGVILHLLDGIRAPLLELIVVFLVCDYHRRRSWFAPIVLVTCAVLLIVFVDFRSAMHQDTELGVSRLQTKFETNDADDLFRRDFEVFHSYDLFLEQVLRRPNHIPYLGGSTFAKLFVFWIPRSIWPEKPLNYHLIVADDMGARPGVSLAPGLHAEGYSNFGWLGMMGIFICLGFFVGLAQNFMNAVCTLNETRDALPWVCMLIVYISFIMRWPFFDGLLRWMAPMLLLTAILRILGIRRKVNISRRAGDTLLPGRKARNGTSA